MHRLRPLLMYADFTPKPAFAAYQEFIKTQSGGEQ